MIQDDTFRVAPNDATQELINELADLRAENERLREALQSLYDEQNGAPLIRDKGRWENAMQLAEEALEATQ